MLARGELGNILEEQMCALREILPFLKSAAYKYYQKQQLLFLFILRKEANSDLWKNLVLSPASDYVLQHF